MKTFIRRPGNKSKHLKHIIPHIPKKFNTYYEPFLGSGAVYLHLQPEKAVLNDLNTDITNIWKLVKSDPEYVIKQIDLFKKKFEPMANEEKLKYCKKILHKIDEYPIKKRTAMYLILVYCSFNGCLILNNNWYIGGLYTHIYKKESCHIFTKNYKDKLRSLPDYLQNTTLYNKDYTQILKKAKKGDFVFIDPPYIEEKSYAFQYNKKEQFDPKQLQRELEKLDKKGVKWLMTQIDTPEIRSLFKHYNFFTYFNNSNVSRIYKESKKELIITNY